MLKTIKNYSTSFFSIFVPPFFIATILATLLFNISVIPSSSMYPNLKLGDRLLTTKFSYGYSFNSFHYMMPWFRYQLPGLNMYAPITDPQRGDIVVFCSPVAPYIYIKRLIGLPGDKIQLIDGELHINGSKLYREKLEMISINEEHRKTEFQIYREYISESVHYRVQYDMTNRDHISLRRINNTGVFEVPMGYYFFLGDNRDRSKDSRFQFDGIGYIARKDLMGKAQFRIWARDFSFWNFITSLDRASIFRYLYA